MKHDTDQGSIKMLDEKIYKISYTQVPQLMTYLCQKTLTCDKAKL